MQKDLSLCKKPKRNDEDVVIVSLRKLSKHSMKIDLVTLWETKQLSHLLNSCNSVFTAFLRSAANKQTAERSLIPRGVGGVAGGGVERKHGKMERWKCVLDPPVRLLWSVTSPPLSSF